MDKTKLTPLLQQYWDIKTQHLDKILLFRMGDFYEMFFDDAIKAAPILNIALTSRNKSQGIDVPMCGVPYHSIGPQINKLLENGIKVAICDQIENPKDAKTIVKRAVTRIVTPGLVYDPDTLEQTSSNYVAAVTTHNLKFSLAAVDASTGEIVTAESLLQTDLQSWLEKLAPKEIIVPPNFKFPFPISALVTPRENLSNISIDSFLLDYIKETQGQDVVFTMRAAETLQVDYLKISATVLKSLELFKTNTGERQGSVVWNVDYCKTPMGSRLLKKRLATPWSTLPEIKEEQDHVELFFKEDGLRKNLRESISTIGDLERKAAKLSNPLCNARDLKALALSLEKTCHALKLSGARQDLSLLVGLTEKINQTLLDELPHSVKEGGLIRSGLNSTLDEYIELSTHAQSKLSELEKKERTQTGIQSLKIKYSSAFGYAFEVTNANLNKVPSHFVRRQTLTGAERYISTKLSDLEGKILSSQQKRFDLELAMFLDLKSNILQYAIEILKISSLLAHLDLRLSWAQLASEQNYCRPKFTEGNISLVKSRHLVLEKCGPETFVPNDIHLENGHCLLLTGPNMAGKSTLMRQVALVAILAQCGAFVPAEQAELPLFDQIFTRIGANDNLSRGQSTFMVEMTETADIINSATNKSLVILDEIGRGTSTYDGLSLAQAVLEYFITKIRPYTFFATHYHELTSLAADFPQVDNGHMSIHENKGELVFLRKLVKGPASRSYGIEVAKQAGLPTDLTSRAQTLLKGLVSKSFELHNKQLSLLESNSGPTSGIHNNLTPRGSTDNSVEQDQELQEIATEIKNIQIENLTPLDALNKLFLLKSRAERNH